MKVHEVHGSGSSEDLASMQNSRIGGIRGGFAGRVAAVLALLALGLLFSASGAKASGCAVPFKIAASSYPSVSPQRDAESNLLQSEEPNQPATIVGLWNVIYTANDSTGAPYFPPAPPSFQFLESYKTWHADGTEFENAFLPPSGGNICFGVWKNLGHGTVRLHHIGLMFNPDASDPATAITNVFTVDEIDTVAPNGKTYKGTFDFKLFDATNVFGTGAPLAEVKGTTAGARITVN
ncbi:MAG: hypothetical protein ACRD4R_10695 [Candidatus Acidiferrales bacterium]